MARKRKSHLLKLMRSGEDYVYETTEADVRYWFNVLNREIFDGSLSPVQTIDIRWRRKTHAYYTCSWDDDKQVIDSTLCMNKKYDSKKFFIEVLGHEMIHHYQALHDEPMGHGPSFLQWEDKFNKKGIRLQKVYFDL